MAQNSAKSSQVTDSLPALARGLESIFVRMVTVQQKVELSYRTGTRFPITFCQEIDKSVLSLHQIMDDLHLLAGVRRTFQANPVGFSGFPANGNRFRGMPGSGRPQSTYEMI